MVFDKATVIQIIGGLMKKPELLLDEKFSTLCTEDFPERFHRLVFGAINNLIKSGVESLTPIEVDSFLSSYTSNYIIFTENDGLDYLDKCTKIARIENFEYSFMRLKKFSLLRNLESNKYDVSLVYDENLLDPSIQQSQQEAFDSMTIDDIVDMYERPLLTIRDEFTMNQGQKGVQASKGMLKLKEEFKQVPEMGAPLGSKILTTITRGARKKKLYMRSAASGIGKALPDYSKIPTPQGWKTVGDIKVGDSLFDRTGRPTTVLGVYPQKESRDIYNVYFKDGRIVETCEDHLWQYNYNEYRPNIVETTGEILARANRLGGFKSKNGNLGFKIPMNKAVRYEKKVYSISPYTLGAMLVDSNLGHNNKLQNKESQDKFIPKEYLLGSIDQRLCLLRGLLDTDGSIDSEGKVAFATTSEQLKNGIIELSRSLGFKPTFIKDSHTSEHTNKLRYIVHIVCNKREMLSMFGASRKIEITESFMNNDKRTEHNDSLEIIDIKPTDIKTPMTCFTVDNDEHLFITGDYIVTHNTRLAVEDICTISVRYWYDLELKEWVDTKYSQPSLFITTELEIEEIQTMIIAHVSGVNEENILNGKYFGDEEDRVNQAIKYIEQSPLWIEHIPSFNMNDIERAIKKYKMNHHIGYVFFDYIFTSAKIMTEIAQQTRGMKLREDNVLYLFVDKMKYLCNTLDIHFNTSSQLNGEYKHVKTADETILRGAKAMADKLDVGFIAMAVTEADLQGLQEAMSAFGRKPNLVYHVYKVRRGKFVRVKLWCYVDLGTCRTTDLFLTNNNYEIMKIESTTVEEIDKFVEDSTLTEEEMNELNLPYEEEDEETKETETELPW